MNTRKPQCAGIAATIAAATLTYAAMPAMAADNDTKILEQAPVITLNEPDPTDTGDADTAPQDPKPETPTGETPTPQDPTPTPTAPVEEAKPTETPATPPATPAPTDEPQETIPPAITLKTDSITRDAGDMELTAETILQQTGATASDGYAINVDPQAVNKLTEAYYDYKPIENDVTLTLTKDGQPVENAKQAIIHVKLTADRTGKITLTSQRLTLKADAGTVTAQELIDMAGARVGMPGAQLTIPQDQIYAVNQRIRDNRPATETIAITATRYGVLDVARLDVTIIPTTVEAHDFTWNVADGRLTSDRIIELSNATISNGDGFQLIVPDSESRDLNDMIQHGKTGTATVEINAWRDGYTPAVRTITVTLTAPATPAKDTKDAVKTDKLAQTGSSIGNLLATTLGLAGAAGMLKLAKRRVRR